MMHLDYCEVTVKYFALVCCRVILFDRGAFCLQIARRRVPRLARARLESPQDKAASATRR